MSKFLRPALLWLLFLAAAGAFAGQASAQTYGSVKLSWKIVPIITLSLTPNYQSGYGPQGGVGSGSTPAPGSGASLDGGVVDFGSEVVQGYSYLYKYALKASVQTNDGGGFTLYAEGASDISDNTAGGTIPLNQTLYWLDSVSSNSPFSNATPFQKTSFASCGTGCINYGGSNPPASAAVWDYTSSTIGQPGNTVSQGFDYELRLFNNPPADNFSVYIVYTAVGN
jgi:hypothetical protein